MSSNTDDVTPSERLIGRVKWFNNKAGYGFITVTDGDRSGSDIFIHHSAINVEDQQYKYLVQGEYVEFNLIKTTSGTHEWQASKVNGIKAGKLMCETRREFKIARSSYKSDSPDETPMPRQPRVPRDTTAPRQRAPRARGEGPREGDKREWTLVNKADGNTRSRPPRQGATVITIESK
jgi:CspA family cold shock protein